MTSHDFIVYQLISSQTVAHSSLPSSSSVYSNSVKSKKTSSSCSILNQISRLNELTKSSNNTYTFSVTISKMIGTIYFLLLNSLTTTPNTSLHKSPSFTRIMKSTHKCPFSTQFPRRTPTLQLKILFKS